MNVNDRVTVTGPVRPEGQAPSAQLGKSGNVVGAEGEFVTVRLDGEDRPRNFRAADLKPE